MRRVAVTGIGVISALGANAGEFGEGLRTGRSGIAPIEGVDVTQLRFKNGAEVRGYSHQRYFDNRHATFLDRFSQFALIAAREAAGSAQIDWGSVVRDTASVVTGSCVGGQTTQDETFQILYRQEENRVHPFSIAKTMSNAGASHISKEFGITGPCFTFSTACASAAHAIGHAFWMIRSGATELAITGGSEAPFSFGFLKAWEAMRVVSPDSCRPFSQDRNGLIIGEGGAMLILEPLDRALARGAPIHGEITGFGMSSDAGHLTQPSRKGPAAAMRAVMRDARLQPEQVGYINAHGTGTRANDVTESEAIRDVFGPHAERLALSSTKSMHGHAFGASPALEAVATVVALRDGFLPPTIHFTGADPACGLDVIPNRAREMRVENALSNSFAFGGLNAVLAFRRWDPASQ